MNKVFALFLHDWRRKLLALGIAFLIWSWVEGQISYDQEVALTLAVNNSEIRSPNNLDLTVEVPRGWVLTEPLVGGTVPITLHCTSSEYDDFISRQCAATIKVEFEVEPISDKVSYPITHKDLKWLRQADADFLLAGVKGGQQLKSLLFQRIETKVLSPNERDVRIVGTPSDAHEAKPEEMEFLPNQITLTGPKVAMEKLNEQINDAHSSDGTLDASGLFSSINLSGSERATVTKSLRLAEEWTLHGISMEPERVMLKLPVRYRAVKPFQWLPDANSLIALPANDAASNGPWTMEAWEPTPWTATLTGIDDLSVEINAQWIEAHVELLIPMNNLDVNSLDRTDLPIKAHLFNFDNANEENFFRKHLVIQAKDPDSAKVTVTRNP